MKQNFTLPRSESVYETIQNIGPEPSSVILFATWISQYVRFMPIFTNEGLCFTFNSMNSEEIYTEEYEIFFSQKSSSIKNDSNALKIDLNP